MKVVFDTNKRPYSLSEKYMSERWGHLPNMVLRNDLKEAIIKYQHRVPCYYLSSGFCCNLLLGIGWEVKLSFFGRLHIGCRTFDRKNTKIILGWARGAQ